MSLGDVMSGAGLAGYAEVALVICVATFVAIAIWVFRRPQEEMEARARTVLEDEGTERAEQGLSGKTERGLRT